MFKGCCRRDSIGDGEGDHLVHVSDLTKRQEVEMGIEESGEVS